LDSHSEAESSLPGRLMVVRCTTGRRIESSREAGVRPWFRRREARHAFQSCVRGRADRAARAHAWRPPIPHDGVEHFAQSRDPSARV